MTTKEAADRCGCTVRTIQQAISAGTLRAERRGRDWWITEASLAAWPRRKGRPPAKARS